MSGFAGFTNFRYRRENTELVLKNMTDTIKERGKDIEAYYDDRYTHIGYRCNFEKDMNIKKASMTLKSGNNEYIIVLDGELYNKEELIETLKKEKIVIRTNQDEEVVLNMFNRFGENFIERIQGVFALAIWNKAKEKLYLARDYLGVKPLFYMQQDSNFVFASEIKAILKFPEVESYISDYGVARMMLKGVINTGEQPLFKNIKKINKCEYMVYDAKGIRTESYKPLKIEQIKAPVIQLIEEDSKINFEELNRIVEINDEPDTICTDIMLIKECKKIGESFHVSELIPYEWKSVFEERKKVIHPAFKTMIEEFYNFQCGRKYENIDLRSIDRISNRFKYNILCVKMNGKFEHVDIRNKLVDIVENKESPVLQYADGIFILDNINQIDIDTIIYLIEIDIWLRRYNVKHI